MIGYQHVQRVDPRDARLRILQNRGENRLLYVTPAKKGKNRGKQRFRQQSQRRQMIGRQARRRARRDRQNRGNRGNHGGEGGEGGIGARQNRAENRE